VCATGVAAGERFVRPHEGNDVERWSRLTRAVSPVLDRIGPVPFSDEDRDLLEILVSDHELGGPEPPGWMVELFEDIAAGRVSRPRRWVPGEYPRGENGLANLLADIEAELFPLGVDDYGEGVSWPVPPFGVRVIIRETSASGPWVYLERLHSRPGRAAPAPAPDPAA
jgi:hypothetical protein